MTAAASRALEASSPQRRAVASGGPPFRRRHPPNFFFSFAKFRYHLMKFSRCCSDIPRWILRLSFRCPKKDSRLFVLLGILPLQQKRVLRKLSNLSKRMARRKPHFILRGLMMIILLSCIGMCRRCLSFIPESSPRLQSVNLPVYTLSRSGPICTDCQSPVARKSSKLKMPSIVWATN